MLLTKSIPGLNELESFDYFRPPHISPAGAETLYKIININEGMGFYILLGLCFTKQKTSGDKLVNKIGPSDLLPHYARGVKVFNDTSDIMMRREDTFPDPVRLVLGIIMAWQYQSIFPFARPGSTKLNWKSLIGAGLQWDKDRPRVIAMIAQSHYAIYNHVYRTNLIELFESIRGFYRQVDSLQVAKTIEEARKLAFGYE